MANSERRAWVTARIAALEDELASLRAEQASYTEEPPASSMAASSSQAIDAAWEESVAQLRYMGFDRAQALDALQAHNGQMEAALESMLLTSGAAASSTAPAEKQSAQAQLEAMGFKTKDVVSALSASGDNLESAVQKLLQGSPIELSPTPAKKRCLRIASAVQQPVEEEAAMIAEPNDLVDVAVPSSPLVEGAESGRPRENDSANLLVLKAQASGISADLVGAVHKSVEVNSPPVEDPQKFADVTLALPKYDEEFAAQATSGMNMALGRADATEGSAHPSCQASSVEPAANVAENPDVGKVVQPLETNANAEMDPDAKDADSLGQDPEVTLAASAAGNPDFAEDIETAVPPLEVDASAGNEPDTKDADSLGQDPEVVDDCAEGSAVATARRKKGRAVSDSFKTLTIWDGLLHSCPSPGESSASEGWKLAETVLKPDPVVQEAARCEFAVQLTKEMDANRRVFGCKVGRLVDVLNWTARVLKAANSAMREDLEKCRLELPQVMAWATGNSQPDWGTPETWEEVPKALQTLAENLWPDREHNLKDRIIDYVVAVVHAGATRTSDTWWEPSCTLKEKMRKFSMDQFLNFFAQHVTLFEAASVKYNPNLVLRQASAAVFHAAASRQIDLKTKLVGLLRKADELFAELLRSKSTWQNLIRARSLSNASVDGFDVGETVADVELSLRLGVKPNDLLAKLGGPQAWRPLPEIVLGEEERDGLQEIPKEEAHEGVQSWCLQRPALGEAVSDPEVQLQSLCQLGHTKVRTMVTEQEKEEIEGRYKLVKSQNLSSARVWWYCEACSAWYKAADAVYQKKNDKNSNPRYHVCGGMDLTNYHFRNQATRQQASTAKLKKLEITSGQELGLKLHATPIAGSQDLTISVQWDLESALRFLDYASGQQAKNIRASVRLASATQPDELVEAGEENDEEEVEEEVGGKEPPSAKKPRCDQTPVNTTGKIPSRFTLLSCKGGSRAPAQPPGLTMPLHDLQRRTVFWMACREGLPVPGFSLESTQFEAFSSTQKINRRLGFSDVSAQLAVERLFPDAHGGILADAVGYGKTASILGLVALSRTSKLPLVASAPRRVYSNATLVIVPANLHQQWVGEIDKFLDKKSFKTISLATFSDVKRVSIRDLQEADVVIVSLRILVSKAYQEHFDTLTQSTNQSSITAQQQFEKALKAWQGKFARHQMYQVRQQQQLAMQMRQQRLGQFSLFAPVVFAPAADLGPPPADPGPKPTLESFHDKTVKNCGYRPGHQTLRQERLQHFVQQLLASEEKIEDLCAPVLEMFYWQRLVVDELHETLNSIRSFSFGADLSKAKDETRCFLHAFENLHARSRWGLTATPNLASCHDVSWLARFHRVFVPRDSDQEAQHYLDAYVRSNDWDDSAIELESHLLPVRHTPSERALYLNHANQEKPDPCRTLQYCSFFSPDGEDDNADAAVVSARKKNQQALEKHKEEMAKAKERLAELEAQEAQDFPDALDADDRSRIRGVLRRLRDSWPERIAKERQLTSRARYFEEMLVELKKLDKEEVECPMCMGKLKPEGCTVTACGHLFCADCILEALSAYNSCPTCREPLQKNQLQSALDILEHTQDSESRGRLAKFGSKLQAVCNQLGKIWQNEPEAKVIIFVQFEVLLSKAESALKDLGFPCQTLKGSVFERRKTIRLFHAPGPEHRVLLVSLEKNPAGMNLVCCHHLILVHPMHAENREAALAYERQAIGRVRRRGQQEKVHVYRFFTRETLEEQLTLAHHQELYKNEVDSKSSSSSSS